MVHPRLRDIQYLHIKIAKADKEKIVAYMRANNFYNISEFVRVTMLKLADESKQE